MAKIGKAYGFFDCEVSKEELERELPNIRGCAKSPSNLELSLTEVKELGKRIDPDLLSFIRENEIYSTFPSKYRHLMKTAKPIMMNNLKYMLEATYRNGTIEEAGDELSSVMNQIYLKYGKNEPFNVAILGKVDGEYSFYE